MPRPTHGDFGDFPARLGLEDAASSRPPGFLRCFLGSAQPYKSPKSPSCGRAALAGVNGHEALMVARSFGIRLVVDGDDLVLKGSEARALACCVVEWLNRNFVPSPPGRSFSCWNSAS
jgi:hypothetical protein